MEYFISILFLLNNIHFIECGDEHEKIEGCNMLQLAGRTCLSDGPINIWYSQTLLTKSPIGGAMAGIAKRRVHFLFF